MPGTVLGGVGPNGCVSRARSGRVAAVRTRGFYSRLVRSWGGLAIFTLKIRFIYGHRLFPLTKLEHPPSTLVAWEGVLVIMNW